MRKHSTNDINALKAYGAALFDSGNSKKSFNGKLEWIDDHHDYILGFKNNDIVNKAENKLWFVSFCFQYKRLINFLNDTWATKFETRLPIQLAANCKVNKHRCLLTKQE